MSSRAARAVPALIVVAVLATACSRGTAAVGTPRPVPAATAAVTSSAVSTDLDPTDADPSASASAVATAPTPDPATPAASTPPYTKVVPAAGVRQYLSCRGTGSPTVVVVTDLSVASADWVEAVAPTQAATRVCRYDRPGVGASPPRTSPHQVLDAGLNARELATLLATAHQEGPYVLVGQGYGALVARAFAVQHPTLVRGLLLGGDAPAASGLFWTEAGHRVAVAASTSAAGPDPQSTSATVVVTEPDADPAALAADLPVLVQQLGS